MMLKICATSFARQLLLCTIFQSCSDPIHWPPIVRRLSVTCNFLLANISLCLQRTSNYELFVKLSVILAFGQSHPPIQTHLLPPCVKVRFYFLERIALFFLLIRAQGSTPLNHLHTNTEDLFIHDDCGTKPRHWCVEVVNQIAVKWTE